MEGKTYIITVNQVGEGSYVYTQSAKNGVIPLTDAKAVGEVRGIVAGMKR